MNTPGLLVSPVALAAAVLLSLTAFVWYEGAAINHITEMAIYILYAVGVNVLIGYLGLVPFGASLFFGCASYTVALTLGRTMPNEIAALVLTILFSIVLSMVLGAIILRRRGLYFSLITLACSQVAFEIAFRWTDLTDGENGIQNVPRPLFESAWAFHWFTVATVVAGLLLIWHLAHTPFGRLMQAVRDNEQRTMTLGYNTFGVKWIGFVISGTVVGVAGGLLAMMLQGAYADNMSWQRAGDPVLMAALGGVHHFLGPVWGAITFLMLEEELSIITDNWWLFFAPIIIVFAIMSPEGMQGIFQRLVRRDRWTLTRNSIPPRPDRIKPYVAYNATEADADVPVLSIQALNKRFGSIVTQNDVSLDVYAHRLHSIIGPNGAGKTTLFNILTGLMPADSGTIKFKGEDIGRLTPHGRARRGIARSFQILSIFPHLTAFENVRIAAQASREPWKGFWRDAYEDERVNADTWSVLAAVGLVERAGDLCSELSHGESRLLEIAITLGGHSSLLLLDEPLAGLGESDREVVADLIRRLARSHTVLLIEHDIDRVLSLSDRITVLHQGRLIADGSPAEIAANPEVVAAYLGVSKDGDGIAKVPAAPASAAPRRQRETRPVLFELKGVSAGYGGGIVLDGVDFEVRESEVVALLGRNGVGKTTALRVMMGTLPPSSGTILFGGQDITRLRADRVNRLGVSIVPEGRRLFPNLTVQENLMLASRPGGASLEEVGDLFPRLRVSMHNKAENLSGGERQMVAIARALMIPSKLILLDEPYEGLAPAIVHEVREAVSRLSTRASLVIVEHHADEILSLSERTYVLVNGQVAYAGESHVLAGDTALQGRLLGITAVEA